MSTKNRTKFTVEGTHPLLGLVRDHFISRGLALVPLSDEPDFCLVGAVLTGNETHPPLAQLELQKMQVGDKPVVLLSTQDFHISADSDSREDSCVGVSPLWTPERRAMCIYALAAEHVFMDRGLARTVVVRPHNVYGPDITWDLIHDTIVASKKGEKLINPRNAWCATSFIHQDDFLKSIDLLIKSKADGIFNVASSEEVTYVNLLRNIWKFIHGAEEEPEIESDQVPIYLENDLPRIVKLHKETGWMPKTSLRSGIFKMVQE
jgi:nucleoside-diphosphate-sugar epimerase